MLINSVCYIFWLTPYLSQGIAQAMSKIVEKILKKLCYQILIKLLIKDKEVKLITSTCSLQTTNMFKL